MERVVPIIDSNSSTVQNEKGFSSGSMTCQEALALTESTKSGVNMFEENTQTARRVMITTFIKYY